MTLAHAHSHVRAHTQNKYCMLLMSIFRAIHACMKEHISAPQTNHHKFLFPSNATTNYSLISPVATLHNYIFDYDLFDIYVEDTA